MSKQKPTLIAALVAALIAALIAIALAALFTWHQIGTDGGAMGSDGTAEHEAVGFMPGQPLGGAFRLTNHAGRPFSSGDIVTAFALIYFGYSYCPDICPTELRDMGRALDAMPAAAAARITPLFITVDPERDDVAAMAEYVRHFHPRTVGLTGTREEVKAVADAYRVFFTKTGAVSADSYLVDHSSFYYLIDPDGAIVRLFTPKATPEALAAALTATLSE